MEENLCFRIDWASLIINLLFLLCLTLYLRAIFQIQAPGGAYIWRGDLRKGFLRYRFGGLIFGGAYIWRGLFSEFYNICLYVVTESSLSTLSGIVHTAKRPCHVSSSCFIVEVKSNVKL